MIIRKRLTYCLSFSNIAREASRRIVDDILIDAGAGADSSEFSPSMVKMNDDILNESF